MRLSELLEAKKKKRKTKRKKTPGIDYTYQAPPAQYVFVGPRFWPGLFGGYHHHHHHHHDEPGGDGGGE